MNETDACSFITMLYKELPTEILMKIFSFCDEKTKFQLRKICSSWRKLIKIEAIYVFVGEGARNHEPEWHPSIMLKGDLDLIKYPDERCIKIYLTDLINITDVIESFPHLSFFYIHMNGAMQFQKFIIPMFEAIKFNLNSIEKLIVEVYNINEQSIDLKSFFQLEITNLKWLILVNGVHNFSIDSQSLNDYLKKCKNLEVLHLTRILSFPQVTVDYLPTKLTHFNLSIYGGVQINDDLDLTKLKHFGAVLKSMNALELIASKLSPSVLTQLVLHLLFTLYPLPHSFDALHKFEKLECLTFQFSQDSFHSDEKIFQRLLRSFPKLKSFFLLGEQYTVRPV